MTMMIMEEKDNIIIESNDYLGSPVDFRFSNLHTDFGILHWQPPETLAEVCIIIIIIMIIIRIVIIIIVVVIIIIYNDLQTVTDYVVNFKKISPQMGDLEKVNNAQSPFILEVES